MCVIGELQGRGSCLVSQWLQYFRQVLIGTDGGDREWLKKDESHLDSLFYIPKTFSHLYMKDRIFLP